MSELTEAQKTNLQKIKSNIDALRQDDAWVDSLQKSTAKQLQHISNYLLQTRYIYGHLLGATAPEVQAIDAGQLSILACRTYFDPAGYGVFGLVESIKDLDDLDLDIPTTIENSNQKEGTDDEKK